MADEVSRRGNSKTAKARKADVIDALGVEAGVDNALGVLSPFSAMNLAGLNKTPDERFHEVMRNQGEDAGPTVRQLNAMRRQDGQARALYRLLTLPIRAALKTAVITGEDDGEDEREFIDKVFHMPPENGGMTVTFSRFMGQLLLGLFEGFSAFEKVFWVPEEGELAGKITLKKLAHRPSETVTFIVDKEGGFAGIRQRVPYYGRYVDVFIPRNRCFYFAAQEEEQKFYGVSFFQSAYYHFDKKTRQYLAAHIAAQRAAVGTRVGTVPQGSSKSAKAEFMAMLANLSTAQWMAMPEGFKVDVLNEAGTYDFLAHINHHNSAMSKSILANFFDKDQGAGQSESSLVNFGQPGDDMFNLMLRGIMTDLEDQINHYIIPQLIDFNFATGKYPKFVWGSLTDEQRAAVAKSFDKLASAQTVTPEFIRALEEKQATEMGLDIDYDEIEIREEEEAEAQRAYEQAGIMPPEGAAPGQPGDPAAAGGPVPPAPGEEAPTDPAAPPTPPEPAPAPADGAPAAPSSRTAPAAPPAPAPAADAPAEPADEWDTLEDFEKAMMGLAPDEEEDDSNSDTERRLTQGRGGRVALSHDDDDFAEFERMFSGTHAAEEDSDAMLGFARSLLDAAGGR